MKEAEQGRTTRQYRQEVEEGREGLVSKTIVIKLAGLLLQGWQGDAVSVKWGDTKKLYMQIYYAYKRIHTPTHTSIEIHTLASINMLTAHMHKNAYILAYVRY